MKIRIRKFYDEEGHDRYCVDRTFILPFIWVNSRYLYDELYKKYNRYLDIKNHAYSYESYSSLHKAECVYKELILLYNAQKKYRFSKKHDIIKSLNLDSDVDMFVEYL
jgi:hypothetical protein